jgi:hypothetical protein
MQRVSGFAIVTAHEDEGHYLSSEQMALVLTKESGAAT